VQIIVKAYFVFFHRQRNEQRSGWEKETKEILCMIDRKRRSGGGRVEENPGIRKKKKRKRTSGSLQVCREL
jgi:hypothetical protein